MVECEIRNLKDLGNCLQRVEASFPRRERPFVAITYAQSVDGSIASAARQPLQISGPESMSLTHNLRAMMDGILVGIETVLTDNPRLTVRGIDGQHPQPVVLDTRLRTPTSCNLIQRPDISPWLACGTNHSGDKKDDMIRAGATLLPCPLDRKEQVDLDILMKTLHRRNLASLMVEGGARVITSFIQSRLVDLFIITISPMLIGGLPVIATRQNGDIQTLSMKQIHYEQMGKDLILWATPDWNRP